jgi:hypothetical protein
LPFPSQVLLAVATPFVHDAAPQTWPDPSSTQLPLPSHLPVSPQPFVLFVH